MGCEIDALESGQSHLEPGALARVREDVEATANRAYALGHADETKPAVAILGGIEAGAVVGDGEEDRAVRAPERDLDRARSGMFGSVSHAFLHHAEQTQGVLGGDRLRRSDRIERDGDVPRRPSSSQ